MHNAIGMQEAAAASSDAGEVQAAPPQQDAVVAVLSVPPTIPIAQKSDTGALIVGAVFAALFIPFVFFAWRNDRAKRTSENERHQLSRDAHLNEQRQQTEYHGAAMRKVNVEHELALSELKMRQAELGEAGDGAVPRVEMNKLVAKKMSLEIEVLSTQLELARRELALRGDQLDFHDVQMERTRLEIESLKLRIKEQRKGLDDFAGE